ncbi:hypothetical protein T484DRAFT_1828084, partial [Baffinella frigidus]
MIQENAGGEQCGFHPVHSEREQRRQVAGVAGELVKYLLNSFNTLSASSTSFAPTVAEIAFVPANPPLSPARVAAEGALLVVSSSARTNGAGAGGTGGAGEEEVELMRFSDVAVPGDRHLVWSVLPVLRAAAAPNEVTRLQLGISSPPRPRDVIAHLANLPSDALARWPLPDPVASVYQRTFDFLGAQWSKISPEDQATLRSLACVPVGDVLVKPSRIFFRLSSDFSPFMFQVPRCFGAQEAFLKKVGARETPSGRELLVPRCFGAQEAFLKKVGARETPSGRDLALFLRELGAECRGNPLNPNELSAVTKVLETVTESHSSAASANLLVPDSSGVLVAASMCFRCSDRRLIRRVDRSR